MNNTMNNLMNKTVDSSYANNNSFPAKLNNANYWLVYSIVWLFVAFLTYSSFFLFHKSFIISSDGFSEYYVALKYYGIYLRQIFRNLINMHRLIIPDWDFCIGEGSDIITTLHSYCIGDPLCLLSFFVPSEYTHYLYGVITLLRLYISGISFSALAFGTGQKNKWAILAGSISYSLCYWGITCASGHPFLVIPMIVFPLMILGIEYILQERRHWFFTIFTATSAICNLYLFYITALLTVFYTLIRLFILPDKEVKTKLLYLIKIAGCAITGVCISACILFPVAMFYKDDQRLSVGQPFHLLYPLYNYATLPGSLLSSSNAYVAIGFIVPELIAIICLFFDKHDNRNAAKLLKILTVISGIFILFPIFGRLFNLMSYATNRWIFAFSLLGSYTLTYKWDTLLSIDKYLSKKIYLSGIALYGVCIFFKDSRLDMVFAMMALYFITAYVINPGSLTTKDSIQSRNRALILIAFFNVSLFGIWVYAPSFNDVSKNNMTYNEVTDKVSSYAENMLRTELGYTRSESGIPLRISGRDLNRNANILNRFSSTQYYWSMTNSYVTSYRALMELPDPSIYSFTNYDDRTSLTALSSTQYYITKEDNSTGIPYGFTPVYTGNSKESLINKYNEKLRSEIGTEPTDVQYDYIRNWFYDPYTIFKNEYNLPITYCYDSFISKEKYEELNPLSRQELLLKTCMIDEKLFETDEYKGTAVDYIIPSSVSCNNLGITYNDNAFVTTEYNTSANISFNAPAGAETYIRIRGLDFTQTPIYDLYMGDDALDPLNLYNKTGYDLLDADEKYLLFKERYHMHYDEDVTLSVTSSNGYTKSFNYRREEAPFSSGRHDYIINMGYSEKPTKSFTLSFPLRGVYSIDSIEIYSIPMDGYEECISDLGKSHLDNVKYDIDSISGTINLDTPKILTAAIPFCRGWSAYIDGSPAHVLAVNNHYIGLEVPKGNHYVSFVYSTPYKKQGLVLSVIGIIIWAVMIIGSLRSEDKPV